MDNNMKNIIILKNLPSNLIDEAIVILKQNKKIKKLQLVENIAKKNLHDNENSKLKKDEFIIKEAENVISDYISKIEKQDLRGDKKVNKLNEKYKKLKKLSTFLLVALIFFIILNFI